MKNRKWTVLLILCLLLFGSASAVLFGQARVKREAQDTYETLKQKTKKPETPEQQPEEPEEPESMAGRLSKALGIDVPERTFDWEALKQENADIYAWLYVPGTKVDYPVLQHPTLDDFYLDHNLDGSKGYPGCIYTQKLNSRTFTDWNTMLYGHNNFQSGIMFQTLHKFEDNVFFEENRYAFIYTPEKIFAYEIFAACEFSDDHILKKYNFDTAEGYGAFLNQVKQSRGMKDHVSRETAVDVNSRLLTMSTCINGKPNNRWIVSAVLLEPEEETGEPAGAEQTD